MAVAQGRGTACPAAFVFALVAALCCCTASATVWTVGNSSGWTIGPNYTTWASGKTFVVGDVLFFPYAQPNHDVLVANRTEYDSCTWSNANTVFAGGNTNITLNTTGSSYYLCSIPTHCTAGMKLAVNVVAATSPTPAPAPAPSSPSPSPAPGSSPTEAPASSPTSGPTTSPASTATPPAPASTTTPSSGPSPPTSSAPPGSSGSTPPGSSSSPPAPTPSSAPCLHAAAGGVAAVLSILLGSTLLL